MKHKWLLIACALGVLFVWFMMERIIDSTINAIPSGLEYDAVNSFSVGGHPSTIETRSFALGNGDEGPAEVIVSGPEFRKVIDSKFNNDLYMDIRPVYVSWQAVDESPGRDLLLWLPDATHRIELIAAQYVSSADGGVHTLNPPWIRRQK